MQASLTNIRKELAELYPKEEIDSFIRLIFEKLKDYSTADLLAKQDELLGVKDREIISKIIEHLKREEPIQYILGETEFYSLTFKVTPDVLIPRPETEELVDWILKSRLPQKATILDVGTGSGCIPISLKKNRPHANVMGCDISERSLQVARENAGINQTEVAFFHLNILNPLLPDSFPHIDVLVSNPPYVRESEKELMSKNVLDFEPGTALFVPDENPLQFYLALVEFSKKHLKAGGMVFLEINEAFGRECVSLLKENGFSNVELRKDLNNKDRMIKAVKR